MGKDINCIICGEGRCNVGEENGYPCNPDTVCQGCGNTGLVKTTNAKTIDFHTYGFCRCVFGKKVKLLNAERQQQA